MTSTSLKNLRTTVPNIIWGKEAANVARAAQAPARLLSVPLVVGLMVFGVDAPRALIAGSPVTRSISSADSAQPNWKQTETPAARGTPQHNLKVSPRNGSARAASATSAGGNSPVTVLRWRTPDVAQVRSDAHEATRLATITTVSPVDDDTYSVRQASATEHDLPLAIPDAFEGQSHASAPHGGSSNSPPAPLEPAPTAQLIAQNTSPSTAAETAWQDDPPPEPELEPAPEPSEQPLPPPAELVEPDQPETQDGERCNRIYNRRNCCHENERCENAQTRWDRDAISKISLDIAPDMYPEKTDPVSREADRNQKLAQSAPRIWRDRDGNILAEGRLTNFERGHLLILNDNNQIVRVPFNELSEDDLCFVTAWWHLPPECTLGDETYAGRNWTPSTLTWKATAACHKPLYFEQRRLERYGHTFGPITQPFLSGAHFVGSLLTVPYQAGINPPWECQYALGNYRPGSCAPRLLPPLPLSVRGALSQAGVIVGGVNLLP